MTNEWKDIWKVFHIACFIVGIADSGDHFPWRKLQQRYLVCSICSGLFYFSCLFWSFLTNDATLQPIKSIEYGVLSLVMVTTLIYYFSLIVCVSGYQKLFKWCEKLNLRLKNDNFNGAAQKSRTVFSIVAVGSSAATVTFFLIHVTTLSVIKGSLQPAIFAVIPFVTTGSLIHGVLLVITELFTVLTFPTIFGFTVGVIVVTKYHYIAVLQSIESLLADLYTHNHQEFTIKITEIVQLYCDLIVQQNFLVNLISPVLLVFEIMCYSLLLLSWIMIFFSSEHLIIAVMSFGNTLPYVFIGVVNETFESAYSRLRVKLYDINWYEMNPCQRKTLLQVMVMISKPKLLTAGPFHVISFGNLQVMFGRIYKFGLVINNVAK